MQKKLSFKKKGIQHDPINHWELTDGNIIAIYQGARGDNPELDFVVKYLAPNKRLRAPSHTHWIVDLLIKSDVNKSFVKYFMETWIQRYESMEPFHSVQERNNYYLQFKGEFTNNNDIDLINNHGYYSIEFISTLIELFIRCEKQTNGAFMFKNLMKLVLEYCEGTKDFYQVISYSKRV